MPSPLFFPALCVVHDDDYDRAMQILGEIYYSPPSQASDWRCPKCSEEVPGNFDSCWQCGAFAQTLQANPMNPETPNQAMQLPKKGFECAQPPRRTVFAEHGLRWAA